MACVKRRRNRWVVDFRDADGKRRWESYRTREEADNALETRLGELRKGTYVPPAEIPTFEEVAKSWLATKSEHRISSYAQWQVHVQAHLTPAIGDMRLDAIRVKHIEQFRDDRRKAGLAPQTVNKLLTTAAAIFNHAAKHELITRNPAAVVDRCRMNAGEMSMRRDGEEGEADRNEVQPNEVLSPMEAARLIESAEPGFYKTYLMTAVLTGARVGELTALTWNDVELPDPKKSGDAQGKVFIRRSLSWARPRGEKGEPKPRFYEPKTQTSRRTIPIGPELVSALRRWKLACSPGVLNLVFPTPEGTPKHRSTITHKGLVPAIGEAKLRRVTLHSLRHTFASALIINGTPITEVAHLLGHSSPAVTMNVYSHWFKDQHTDAVANLTRSVLGGGSKVVAGAVDGSTGVP